MVQKILATDYIIFITMDLNQQVAEKVKSELQNSEFGVTQQFLEVHEIEMLDDNPVILRVDEEEGDGTVIAYLKVKDESFYFAVYFDTVPDLKIRWLGSEAENTIYFRAQSESLDAKQLAYMFGLTPTRIVKRGEVGKFGGVNKFNAILFEPNPEPDEFEDKLTKLLVLLEANRDGIRKLADQAGGYIQAAITFHNGNTALGGPHLDAYTVSRLSSLGLSINFDLYATGNSFKE